MLKLQSVQLICVLLVTEIALYSTVHSPLDINNLEICYKVVMNSYRNINNSS